MPSSRCAACSSPAAPSAGWATPDLQHQDRQARPQALDGRSPLRPRYGYERSTIRTAAASKEQVRWSSPQSPPGACRPRTIAPQQKKASSRLIIRRRRSSGIVRSHSEQKFEKKVDFVEPRLLARIEAMNAAGEKEVIKTWSRASTIFPKWWVTPSPCTMAAKHVLRSTLPSHGWSQAGRVLADPYLQGSCGRQEEAIGHR